MSNVIQTHIDKALKLTKDGNFDDAFYELDCAEDLAYQESDEHELLWKIQVANGRTYTANQEYDLAEIAFEDAYGLNSAVVEEIQLWRGVNYFLSGKEEKGLQQLSCAYSNGGEAIFAQVDPSYLERVIQWREEPDE